MSGGFAVSERKVLDGIPVLSNGDPVEPTIVCTKDMRLFTSWCKASKVHGLSGNVLYISLDSDSHSSRHVTKIELGSSWKWVVFVATDPRCYNEGGVWATLGHLRQAGQFTRAWVYPHLWIEPKVYDNAATIGMDEWEGF